MPAIATPANRIVFPAPVLLLASMSLVQVGNALAIGVFDEVGAFGAGWLRLVWAAVLLLVLVRPKLRSLTPAQRLAAVQLGVTTGVLTLAFAGAIDRLALGTAAALEFLGPLGVAFATRAPGRAGVLLPVVAGAGVLALTEPWTGATDGLGVLLGLVAAGAWAVYIVLTQRVGALLPGLSGIALSFAVAAIVMTPIGLADAADGLDAASVSKMAGIAVLVPLVPFVLEFVALRRMSTATFGILMCLEPAIALLVGVAALGQAPGVLGAVGIALVVSAGVLARRALSHVGSPGP